MHIGIVGAGIGGLVCALASHDAGHDVVVYEQASTMDETGAGIQLGPNAVKALLALGLDAALARASVCPSAVRLRAFGSGRLIAERPLGAAHEARYGAPYYQLQRHALIDLLARALRARGVPLHLAHGCIDARPRPDAAELVFDNCMRAHHDLVVGADGIHSTVRRALFGDDAPVFTGCVAYRALVSADLLPSALRGATATIWLGPGAHVVHYPVDGGLFVNVVAVAEATDWTLESWRQPAGAGELAAAFAGWHADVRALLTAAGDCYKWALHERRQLRRWQRGRVLLLGDACHPMLPFLAQGAAMAIEDASLLGTLLASSHSGALSHYERLRRPRVARVVAASRANARMFHRRHPLAVRARDARLGLGSRLLPALALRQFDWLYGYEPRRPRGLPSAL